MQAERFSGGSLEKICKDCGKYRTPCLVCQGLCWRTAASALCCWVHDTLCVVECTTQCLKLFCSIQMQGALPGLSEFALKNCRKSIVLLSARHGASNHFARFKCRVPCLVCQGLRWRTAASATPCWVHIWRRCLSKTLATLGKLWGWGWTVWSHRGLSCCLAMMCAVCYWKDKTWTSACLLWCVVYVI